MSSFIPERRHCRTHLARVLPPWKPGHCPGTGLTLSPGSGPVLGIKQFEYKQGQACSPYRCDGKTDGMMDGHTLRTEVRIFIFLILYAYILDASLMNNDYSSSNLLCLCQS